MGTRSRNSSHYWSASELTQLGQCGWCRGTGVRPTTGLLVEHHRASTFVGVQLTWSRGWSGRLKRYGLALLVSASAVAGPFTWTFERVIR